MATEFFEIVKSRTDKDILKEEELGFLSGVVVKKDRVHEIQLRNGCTFISLLCDANTYNRIKNDTKLMVRSIGWWATLNSPNVTVYRENGEVIHARNLF